MRATYVRGPEATRFWAKVDLSDSETCWIWTAAKNEHGYGIFRRSDGTNIRAHRWSWIELRGPHDEGLVLDHLCRNRACVNPSHLEPVTQAENCRRGEPGGRSWRKARTECRNGHTYTDATTYVFRGVRICKLCRNASDRRRRQRLREAASG